MSVEAGQDSLAQDFVQFAVEAGVLRFGEFKTKAGRLSPYFFNAGLFDDGAKLGRLAQFYAQRILASGVEFDMLFGPAYKGIPLVAAVACALAQDGVDLPFAYNRKEAKDHGEGGLLVGAPPKGRVVIVDDVLTAGTALREAIGLLREAGANPVAALIALDRQEVGPNGRSAVAELEAEAGLRVIPLVTVQDVMAYLAPRPEHAATLAAMRDYQSRYGVNSGA